MAVDPGDDGLLAIEQGKDDALGLPRGLAEALVDHRLHPGDVAPRAEGAPRAREHDHIGPRVIGCIAEDRRELRMERGVDGVEFIGPVEGQREDPAAALVPDEAVAREVDQGSLPAVRFHT